MFFCHELGGHCPQGELSAPGGRLSCLNENITPHLALEKLQQLRLVTVAGLLDRREISNHSLEGEWLGGGGGKWLALRDVILGPRGIDRRARTDWTSLFPLSKRLLVRRVGCCAVPRCSACDGWRTKQSYAAKCTVLGEVRLGNH